MKIQWRFVFGLALSAAAIVFILRTADLRLVWENVQRSNVPLLILAAVVATTIFPIRAIRWKVILNKVDPDVSWNLLWRATAVGFAINNSLPGRVGEVARAYALSREAPKIGFTGAFASLAVDRVFDAITLLLFLVIGVWFAPPAADQTTRDQITGTLVTVGIGIAGLFIILFVFAFFPSRIIGLYQLFARKIAPSLEVRGAALLASIAGGLSALSHPGRFLLVLLWSVIHWGVNAAAFWIGFMALGLDMPNSFAAALVTQSIIAFAIAAPSAPGGLGLFQAAAPVALGMFGVPAADAIAWAFAFWIFSFIPITIIGYTYFVRMGITLKELRGVIRRIKDGGGGNDAS